MSAKMPHSLGAKLVLILSGVGLAGSLAIAALLLAVITPSFGRLENATAAAHVERTRGAIEGVARDVLELASDYGDWNASYAYLAERNGAFEQGSLSATALLNLDVGGIAFVDRNGRLVFSRWVDNEGADARIGPMPRWAALVRRIDPARQLGGDAAHAFYVNTGDRLIAVGVSKVCGGDMRGDTRGYVLVARAVTDTQFERLLQLPVRLDLAHSPLDAVAERTSDALSIAVPLAAPDGRPAASLRLTIARELSLLGERMLFLAVAGAVVLLIIVLVALRRIIARLVLQPLARIRRHMRGIQQSGVLDPLMGPDAGRRDEIGELVGGLNAMLRQLRDLREQVEVQSYELGRSDSAVAVVHNVRNALNPIATLLSQGSSPAQADRDMLDRALRELADGNLPTVRRHKLVAFVAAALEAQAAERAQRQCDLTTGREALRNVLEIIGRQQEQAHDRPPLAPCDLTDIVARNATIARYTHDGTIAVIFPSTPHMVLANRVILSQIVGNLFANAAEAIAARGGEGGTIAVAIHEIGSQVELSIRDDGEGFDQAIKPQLFQRGFSTRAHKAGGLGLHWCANAVRTMGGTLRLESGGRGCGAHAILTLEAARLDHQLAAA